jgi:general stress protein YciG
MERGQKIKASNIAKYGSEEAYKQHLREVAAKGGSAKVQKGFSMMTAEQRKEAGRKGGTRSKRTK